jgi:hypothetical protein
MMHANNVIFSIIFLPLLLAYSAPDTLHVAFTGETPGAEAKAFSSFVGNWHIDVDGSKQVLAVDGRKWSNTMSPGIADKAKAIYGERYAEFLDNLESYKYFPLCINRKVTDFKKGAITVRFKGVSGRIDQGAGIAFNIRQNGNYLVIRANCLENNLVLFKLEEGKRTSVQWMKNVKTPTKQWNTLKVVIDGARIEGYLNDNKYIDFTWKEPVSGKVGLWSKADSYMFFDDFTVFVP